MIGSSRGLPNTSKPLNDFKHLGIQIFLIDKGGIGGVPFPDFPEDYVQISRIPEESARNYRIMEDN